MKNLTEQEQARWMALLIAVDLIDKQCEKLKMDFDSINLKSCSLKSFIDEKAKEIQYNYLMPIKENILNKIIKEIDH
jgi:hypothetical protein